MCRGCAGTCPLLPVCMSACVCAYVVCSICVSPRADVPVNKVGFV